MLPYLLILIFGYLIYLTVLYFSQNQLVFPTKLLPPARQNLLQDVHGADLISLASDPVDALYYPGASNDAVIIAHGNGERIEYWTAEAESLSKSVGVHVLLIEYPGYQGDKRTPSQKVIREGYVAGYDWLKREKGVSSIHGLGLSIGSGVICDLSQNRELSSLTLLVPFASIRKIARKRLAPDFLIKNPYDNDIALSEFEGPILIFPATEDKLFKLHHSERLAEAQPKAEVHPIPGGHNDVLQSWSTIESKLGEMIGARKD